MSEPQLRALRRSDSGALLELYRRIEAVDRVGEHHDLADVEHSLVDPQLDLGAATRGWFDGDRALGFVTVHAVGSLAQTTGGVDPAMRRHGHGTALLRWAFDHASDTGADTIGAGCNDAEPDAVRLFTSVGMSPVRHWRHMRHPVEADPGSALDPAQGALVTTAVGDLAGESLRLAHGVAFAGHFGSTPPDPVRWAQSYTGSPEWSEPVSVVARAGSADGELAGYALVYERSADTAATGVREAYLGQLGVLPGWRGRGAGSLLLSAVLARAGRLGFGRVSLTVDSANGSGALGMYERAGFVTVSSHTSFRGPVAGARTCRAAAATGTGAATP